MSITVVGLDKEGVYLDDLRKEVPYQVAVSLPTTLTQSRDLRRAINEKRVFPLQGSLPAGAVFRGGGAVPGHSAPALARPRQDPKVGAEVTALKAENVEIKKKLAEKETLNTGLQTTLSAMATQLTSIQGILEALEKKGFQVASVPGGTVVRGPGVEDDAPMFIPSVKRDDIKTNITVEGTESTSDLDAAKNALKALRKKNKNP